MNRHITNVIRFARSLTALAAVLVIAASGTSRAAEAACDEKTGACGMSEDPLTVIAAESEAYEFVCFDPKMLSDMLSVGQMDPQDARFRAWLCRVTGGTFVDGGSNGVDYCDSNLIVTVYDPDSRVAQIDEASQETLTDERAASGEATPANRIPAWLCKLTGGDPSGGGDCAWRN